MVIAAVDRGLEELLRRTLPLPSHVGDVAFDAPDRTWGAQLSRLTVNLFLFDVRRSPLPPMPMAERTNAAGKLERRAPLPLIELNYLVSAWAGTVSDEHQLLGDVLACFLSHQSLPADCLPDVDVGPVQLSMSRTEGARTPDLWSKIDGRLRPSFELQATIPLDTVPWVLGPPPVERIQGMAAPRPSAPPRPAVPTPSPLTRRRAGDAVFVEGRPDANE